MKEEQFIKKYSSTWTALENLTSAVNKRGIRSLPSSEVRRFLHVFRQCSHHLAYARTYYPDSSIASYLNSLVAKCHSHVYAVNKVSPGQLLAYITYGYPRQLKDFRWFIIAAFVFFALGAASGLLMVLYDTGNAGLFLPGQIIDNIKNGRPGGDSWNYPIMSSFIMFNNITIAIKSFIYGITFGLGTIYILFVNGALLGALTALIYLYGNPASYWSLILPHGVIELTAVFISGAAGLLIAKSILIPGEYSRRHALIDGAKKSVSLISGVVFMLVIAGIIEGFFTPLKISAEAKLLFAAITSVLLAGYFIIPYVIKR